MSKQRIDLDKAFQDYLSEGHSSEAAAMLCLAHSIEGATVGVEDMHEAVEQGFKEVRAGLTEVARAAKRHQ